MAWTPPADAELVPSASAWTPPADAEVVSPQTPAAWTPPANATPVEAEPTAVASPVQPAAKPHELGADDQEREAARFLQGRSGQLPAVVVASVKSSMLAPRERMIRDMVLDPPEDAEGWLKQYERAVGRRWDRSDSALRDELGGIFRYALNDHGEPVPAAFIPKEMRQPVLGAVRALALEGKYGKAGFGEKAFKAFAKGAISPLIGANKLAGAYRSDDPEFVQQYHQTFEEARNGNVAWYSPEGLVLGGLNLTGAVGAQVAGGGLFGGAGKVVGAAGAFGLPAAGNTAEWSRDHGLNESQAMVAAG
ncbi:MAG: hypothetical protein LLG00_12650, partial [Planctomycetaceae bacterium]|nr:hypothetical protein [Planctomycetaceae bacterium]